MQPRLRLLPLPDVVEATSGTAAHTSKRSLYKPEATLPDLFGDLEGAVLWTAIKETYQVDVAAYVCVWVCVRWGGYRLNASFSS